MTPLLIKARHFDPASVVDIESSSELGNTPENQGTPESSVDRRNSPDQRNTSDASEGSPRPESALSDGRISLSGSPNASFQVRELALAFLDVNEGPTLPQTEGDPGLHVFHSNPSFPPGLLQRIQSVLTNWTLNSEEISSLPGGTSHSILFTSNEGPLAVFKPEARELGGDWDNIVSSYKHITSKAGINPGEGAFREYLASLYIREFLKLSNTPLDQMAVVNTAYVTCASEGLYTNLGEQGESDRFSVIERGSLHQFESNCRTYREAKDSESVTSISTPVAHLLAILDMVLMNSDRNSGNLLIQENKDGSSRLVLIDHSAILPSKGESSANFAWLDWPQLQEPMSPETIAFVEQLTPETLIDILGTLQHADLDQAHNFNPDSLWVHGFAIQLLQQGICKGLSLYEIASLLPKLEGSYDEEDNAIAFLFKKINERGNSEIKVAIFLEEVDVLLDNYKEKLEKLKLSNPGACPKMLCNQAKEFCFTNTNTSN